MMRWPIVVLIAGLLVAGVSYDRVEHLATDAGSPPFVADVNPELHDPPAVSSVWYCPVGSAGGGYAEHTVEVANLGAEPAVATVGVLTDDGPGPSIRLDIGTGARRSVALAELESAPVAGAVVEVVSGQGVVTHEVDSPHGPVRGACATGTSDEWHFAGGVTTRDATHTLALLNPFPEDAVFDVRFEATGRSRVPSDLQGAVVPARSVRLVDVGASVAREGAVATTVTLRRGRVVAERLQSFDGVLGPVGSALQLGAPSPSLQSWFPAGRIHAGGDQRLVLYNPGVDVAEVDVALQPHDPSIATAYGLVPLEVSIGPGRFEVVDLVATATNLGVPLPLEVGLHVQSVNGVPVVGERWSLAPPLDRTAIGADAEPVPAAPEDAPDAGSEPPPPAPEDEPDAGSQPAAPQDPAGAPPEAVPAEPGAEPAPPEATPDASVAPEATPPGGPTDGEAEAIRGAEANAGAQAAAVPVALQAPRQEPAPEAPPAPAPPAPGAPPAPEGAPAPEGEPAPGTPLAPEQTPAPEGTLVPPGGAPPGDPPGTEGSEHDDVPAEEAPPADAAVPAPTQDTPTRGVAIDRGVVTAATSWLLPGTPMLAGGGTVLVIVGVDDSSTVEVRPLATGSDPAGRPATTIEVAAGERMLVPLSAAQAVEDVLVSASGRVAVAASLVDGQGSLAVVSGIPVLERETS